MAHKDIPSIDDKITWLVQPDVLLADQFAATFRARDSLGPEKRLILAILEEAIHCFQKYMSAGGRRSRALFRDTEEWILEKNSDWPFSFENSCLALGLDPGYVRRGLLYWRNQEFAQCQKQDDRYFSLQSHCNQHRNGGQKSAGAKKFTNRRNTIQLGKGVSP